MDEQKPETVIQQTEPVVVIPGAKNAPEARKKVFKIPSVKFSPEIFKKYKKPLIFGGIFLGALVLFAIVLSISSNKNGGILPLPTATPNIDEAPEVVVNPSQYADDEDIATINERITELDRELSLTNLREENLRIPSVDWNVNFE